MSFGCCPLSMQLFAFGVIALFLVYKWVTGTFDFFAKRNISFERPIPLFGNLGGIVFGKETVLDVARRLYTKYKSQKYYGTFNLRTPILTIADLGLIKQIGVKDFASFPNHRSFIEPEDHVLLATSLFFLKDQRWKDMRTTLSPAFTGNKLRQMLPLISKCCLNGSDYLWEKTSRDDGMDLDINDFFIRYTVDVMASTAFGVEINSLKDVDNDFYRIARQVMPVSLWATIRIFLCLSCRKLMRFLKISIIDESFLNYFKKLVLNTISLRSQEGIVRHDMINLLMQAQEEYAEPKISGFDSNLEHPAVDESKSDLNPVNSKWSDDEIVAQCFMFLAGGFGPTSSTMSFCAYEIMAHPDVQQKLLAEVDKTRESLNGSPITYGDLEKMKYLDMVISETLRKWPTNVTTERVCSRNYQIENVDTGDRVDLEPGQNVEIPIAGLHYDPEYWTDPENFDPERFNDENKKDIKPFTYLPFGIGPRNCIGSRFALIMMKASLYHLLSEFTLQKSSKTQIPLTLVPLGIQYTSKGGFWMKIKPRNI